MGGPKTPTVDIAALIAEFGQNRTGAPCWYATLDQPAKAYVAQLLPEKSLHAKTIARALNKKFGVPMLSTLAIGRHRRGDCRCGK